MSYKGWRRLGSPFLWIGLMTGFAAMLSACIPNFESRFMGDAQISRETVSITYGDEDYAISFLRAGDKDGQQVIFVHGTPGSAEGWLRYLRDVPPGREYIALDRPGFGQTRPVREAVSLDVQAAAVHKLMQRRGTKKPILVGHSLGGPIVVAVASTWPDAVGGLIPLAASVDPSQEKIKLIQYIGEIPPFVWMIPAALRHTNREVFALEDELDHLASRLDHVTAPTIIIHGTADDLVPYANVAYLQDRLTGATPLETVTLTGQNHFLPWNSQSVLDAAITRIIDGFPGGRHPKTVLTPKLDPSIRPD